MTTMPFGKYEDEDLEWIVETDVNYLYWLLGQDWFREKFEDLYDEIEELVDGLEA